MSDLTTAGLTLQGLATADTETLRRELGRAMRMTAESLVYLAAIWHELESRGVDLSALRTGLSAYLPLIASGRADPEAVIAFAGQPTLMRAITQLPVDEQRRLAAGGAVRVVIQTPDGVESERDITPNLLSAAEVRRVFAPGAIRSPAEQSRLIRTARSHARRAVAAPPFNAARAADFEPPPVGDDAKNVVIPLSPAEHEALKVAAARLDLPLRDLARRIILAGLEG
ncbi:hypothetical protein [Methylocystis sp. S23]